MLYKFCTYPDIEIQVKFLTDQSQISRLTYKTVKKKSCKITHVYFLYIYTYTEIITEYYTANTLYNSDVVFTIKYTYSKVNKEIANINIHARFSFTTLMWKNFFLHMEI